MIFNQIIKKSKIYSVLLKNINYVRYNGQLLLFNIYKFGYIVYFLLKYILLYNKFFKLFNVILLNVKTFKLIKIYI